MRLTILTTEGTSVPIIDVQNDFVTVNPSWPANPSWPERDSQEA